MMEPNDMLASWGSDAANLLDEKDMEYAKAYIPRIAHGPTLKVCFFIAEPDGLEPIDVHKEILIITNHEKIKKHVKTDIYTEVKSTDFLPKLEGSFDGEGPHIFHFAGHSENGNLALQDAKKLPPDEDGYELVEHTDVTSSLRLMSSTSPLCGLVLNGCQTEKVWTKLERSSIGFAIFTNKKISSKAAVCFAEAFYRNIAMAQSLWCSFVRAVGQVRIQFESGAILEDEAKKFVLYVSKDKLEKKVGATMNSTASESSAASPQPPRAIHDSAPHTHSIPLSIVCRGSMPHGVEFIDKQVIERLGIAGHIPPNILHVACHAKRNDDLVGGLDFSGIAEGEEGTLDYVDAAYTICDWCGVATGGKTDLVFFNACHSHKVGIEVLKIMDRIKSKMPRIIAWEGAVPNELCNRVADHFYTTEDLVKQWSGNFNFQYFFESKIANFARRQVFQTWAIHPLRGDAVGLESNTYEPVLLGEEDRDKPTADKRNAAQAETPVSASPVETPHPNNETPEPESGHDGYRFYTRFEAEYKVIKQPIEEWVEEITKLKPDESPSVKFIIAFFRKMGIKNTDILVDTFLTDDEIFGDVMQEFDLKTNEEINRNTGADRIACRRDFKSVRGRLLQYWDEKSLHNHPMRGYTTFVDEWSQSHCWADSAVRMLLASPPPKSGEKKYQNSIMVELVFSIALEVDSSASESKQRFTSFLVCCSLLLVHVSGASIGLSYPPYPPIPPCKQNVNRGRKENQRGRKERHHCFPHLLRGSYKYTKRLTAFLSLAFLSSLSHVLLRVCVYDNKNPVNLARIAGPFFVFCVSWSVMSRVGLVLVFAFFVFLCVSVFLRLVDFFTRSDALMLFLSAFRFIDGKHVGCLTTISIASS
jgi:hypothetical protein